jgi:hypothetical protein
MRYAAAAAAVPLLLAAASLAAPPAKKPAPPAKKPPAGNQVKGQGQLAGSSAEFGTVYSLQNGFNLAILSARYTVEPYVAYTPLSAGTDKKLFVLGLAIKNARPDDNYFSIDSLFTLVDDTGATYPNGSLRLVSRATDSASVTLRPGQGVGQPALNDPLEIAFELPAKAKIVKVMVNQGRATVPGEQVLRYYLAGATRANAGADGDPKNVAAPLPAEERDPSDPSGATLSDESKGTKGQFVTSGWFGLRFDGLAYTTDALKGDPPPDGKKYAVVTVTARSLSERVLSMFDVTEGDAPLYEITDADGERYKPEFYRKLKADEDPEREFKKGDEYAFRVVFVLPKDAAAKKLVLGTGGALKWAYDVSDVK